MKYKVGITSRIIQTKEYVEIRDVISHDMIDFCSYQEAIPIVIPNNKKMAEFYLNDLDLLILSGGNDLSSTLSKDDEEFPISYLRDNIEKNIITLAINKEIPILGICRGMQMLNSYFGGTLQMINTSINHVSVNHEIMLEKESFFLFNSNNTFVVASYHNYGIDKLGDGLIPLARSKDHLIESFQHKNHKIFGLMWHPERELHNSSASEFYKNLFRRIIEEI